MVDETWIQRLTDEELNALFDRYVLGGAYQGIVGWKMWAIGITILCGIGASIDFINRMIAYKPVSIWQFILCAAAAYCLFWIFGREKRHGEMQRLVRREITRRS